MYTQTGIICVCSVWRWKAYIHTCTVLAACTCTVCKFQTCVYHTCVSGPGGYCSFHESFTHLSPYKQASFVCVVCGDGRHIYIHVQSWLCAHVCKFQTCVYHTCVSGPGGYCSFHESFTHLSPYKQASFVCVVCGDGRHIYIHVHTCTVLAACTCM